MSTLAVLPVKSFSRAKQRLRDGVSMDLRPKLAEAMFTDVLSALCECTRIGQIVVVSGGRAAREIAEQAGIRVIEDRQQGHNAAARLGIEAALSLGAERVLLVPGDCPALEPSEIDGLLEQNLDPPSVSIVPDRHGTGTNALLLAPPGTIEPAFGPGSCERHVILARAVGAAVRVAEVPSLALDVDTPEDLDALEAAIALRPAASRTRRLLSELSKC